MENKTYLSDSNIEKFKWYSVEEYNVFIPVLPDILTWNKVLVKNDIEYSGDNDLYLVHIPIYDEWKSGWKFETSYADEILSVTHFMFVG